MSLIFHQIEEMFQELDTYWPITVSQAYTTKKCEAHLLAEEVHGVRRLILKVIHLWYSSSFPQPVELPAKEMLQQKTNRVKNEQINRMPRPPSLHLLVCNSWVFPGLIRTARGMILWRD